MHYLYYVLCRSSGSSMTERRLTFLHHFKLRIFAPHYTPQIESQFQGSKVWSTYITEMYNNLLQIFQRIIDHFTVVFLVSWPCVM